MSEIKPPLIVIAGPTASGKSDVGIELAEAFGTEIISGDSVQVYKHFDIGAAKPTPEMLRRVRHHLISVAEPEENFTVARFREEAERIAGEMATRNMVPLVVGGTGLYIKALVEGMHCGEKVDAAAEARMDYIAREEGLAGLYALAVEADPVWMKKIHPNDTFRTRRALGVYFSTGKRMSEIYAENPGAQQWDALILVLDPPRDILYSRINRRVDQMLENGWREEVKRLLDLGYNKKLKPMRALGYKTIIEEMEGRIGGERAAVVIKQETRAFAKRQVTWFRGIKTAIFIPVAENYSATDIADSILRNDEFIRFKTRHSRVIR